MRRAGAGIAAIRVGSAYAETLKLALELHPSTERVFVVARSPNKQNVDSVRAELRDFSQRVQLTYLDEETLPRLLEAVKAVPPGSLILYIWQRGQTEGHATIRVDVARLVAEAAPVPVYGTNDLNIGTGIVGGVVRGTRETGVRVGEDGAPDSRRHAAAGHSDRRRAARADVRLAPAAALGHRSDRGFRRIGHPILRRRRCGNPIARTSSAPSSSSPPSCWLIAGLLTQRARRRRAEETVLAREATLRTSYERIRQLAGRLINAQEAARAGIARDLHDDVCQELVGVSIAVGSLKSSSGAIQDAHTQQALSKLRVETLGMFEGVRRLSHDLHPATLRLVGLAAALRAHCVEVEKRHDVQVRSRRTATSTTSHPDVALCFFRIAQESLRNGVVHGEARRLSVSLARSGDDIELTSPTTAADSTSRRCAATAAVSDSSASRSERT